MALRNTKIAREIVSNNYKYLSNKADVIVPLTINKEITANVTEVEGSKESTPFRYIVSNTKRPSVLPKIEFPKEPEELIPPEMRHLQPSMLPKFMELREVKNQVEWEPSATERELECPFPEPIRELRSKTLTISDMKKAELKHPSINVNFKNNNLNVINRNYSTSPFFTVSRSFAKKTRKDEEKCDESMKKCRKNETCPSFVIKNCPVGKPKSDCARQYMGLKCTKKNAPYPSYSESCAERLDDDPSECMQCPWQKCGGVEAIKPQKRNYHTSIVTSRNLALTPGYPTNKVTYSPFQRCDAKKEPCKRPPGKCDKRDQKKKEKEKCPDQPKKKKCSSWTSAYGLWSAKENVIPMGMWQDVVEPSDTVKGILDCEGCKKFPFDKDQADYDKVRNRNCKVKKNPKCQRKKRRILPEGCPSDSCKKECAEDIFRRQLNYQLDNNCDKSKSKNDKNKCPKRERKCPVVDTSIDERFKPKTPCCEQAKKGMHRKPKPHQTPKIYVPEPVDY